MPLEVLRTLVTNLLQVAYVGELDLQLVLQVFIEDCHLRLVLGIYEVLSDADGPYLQRSKQLSVKIDPIFI